MDLDRLIADAKELCRDVARLELTGSPLYIVTQTMLPPMLGATTVCYGYAIRKYQLEPLVVSRIVDLLDTPNIQRRLQKAISRQMKATASDTRDTKPLRQRIAELEKNIAKGVERLLLLDGEELNDASRLLADWRQQRRTAEEQLQASEHKRNASPQREAVRVAAELADLRETFAVADPATLRAALATVIEDITLYWTDGGPRKYRFQRGTIRFGGILRLLASCEIRICHVWRCRYGSVSPWSTAAKGRQEPR